MNHELNLYGIPNCNTVKQARSALVEAGWQVCFHDLKKVGVDPQVAAHWLTKCDWPLLINRQGTTWRQLSEAEKDAVTDAQTAVTLMQKSPSVIKRPVICWPDGEITVGWGEAAQNKMSRP
jgi:Spx/MgsR family transcriptional regulator